MADCCVDELFLTIAPQLAGRNPGLIAGVEFLPEAAPWLDIVSMKEQRGPPVLAVQRGVAGFRIAREVTIPSGFEAFWVTPVRGRAVLHNGSGREPSRPRLPQYGRSPRDPLPRGAN